MSATLDLSFLSKVLGESSAELDRLSEKAKSTTGPLQRLQESVQALSEQLQQLPAAMSKVGSGSKAANDDIEQGNKGLEKTASLTQRISGRMKKFSEDSGINKVAAQAKATGSAMMNAGRNVVGWMDALAAADETKELTNSWNAIKDQFTGLKSNFLSEILKSGVGAELAKTLKQISKRIAELSDNGTIKELAKSIGDVLGGAIKYVSKLINFLLDAVEWSINTFGSSKPVIIAVAAVLSGPLLASLYSATSAIVGLGVAFLATPIGQFLALVGLIAAAAAMIFTDWNPIAEYFPELWTRIVDTVGPVVAFLVNAFEPVTSVVRTQFSRLAVLFGWLGEHWDVISEGIVQGVKLLFLPWRLLYQVVRWAVGKATEFLEGMGLTWGDVFAVIVDVIKRLIKTWVWLVSLFISPIDAIGDALDYLSKKWNDFVAWIAPGVEVVKNLLLGIGESIASGVMEDFNEFLGFFEKITNPNKLLENATQKITNLFSSDKGKEKNKSESSGLGPSAPTLAPGGFFGQFNGEILVRFLQEGMLRVEQQSASRNLTLRTETGAALMAG